MKYIILIISILLLLATDISSQDYYRLNCSDVEISGDTITKFKFTFKLKNDSIYYNATPDIIVPSQFIDTQGNLHNVKVIGKEAFKYTENWMKQYPNTCHLANRLHNIIIEDGIEYIGTEAFSCNNIRSITFPKTLKKIGNKALYKNNIFTETLYTQEWDRIDSVENLEMPELVIPASVEEIGDSAFLTFPDKIEELRGSTVTRTF